MNKMDKELQTILDKLVDGKKIFGTTFAIKKGDVTWIGASGNLSSEQPYFIASTTKLFTTAIILHLRSEGQLNLGDKISKYVDRRVLSGLHIYRGEELSNELTIRNLLSHTSGLPDYFQGKGANGKSLENELTAGHDRFWTFEQAIEITKTMKPLFAPGAKNKAHYSDANFQLLGNIIENITQKSYSKNCHERIMGPLGLSKTYLYQDSSDKTPQAL